MNRSAPRILVLSFYYTPDLSAGSFRTAALIGQLRPMLPDGATVDVITTCPNRYRSFDREVELEETAGPIKIHRVRVPRHQSGVLDQSRTFLAYALGARRIVRGKRYDLIYATSSRLMTAFLGAHLSRSGTIPLYLDIRDIFVDTVGDVFRNRYSAPMIPLLAVIERYTINSAARVNLVSRGFEEYFRHRFPKQKFDFFTNGIDGEFVSASFGERDPAKESRLTRVVYAGNIGHGQGLHTIIPRLASATSDSHEYMVVGDGGARRLLESALARERVKNVRILPPMERSRLLGLYRDADVLFLHLNDLPAFEKVLPSKIFEYAATGKPILAGVAGYARVFIKSEIANARIFRPCDVTDAMEALFLLDLKVIDRRAFVETYRRENIMRAMGSRVLGLKGCKEVNAFGLDDASRALPRHDRH